MERYADAVAAEGARANVLELGPAHRWDAVRQWVEEDRDLRALVMPCSTLLAGDQFHQEHSWVVADRFSASRE